MDLNLPNGLTVNFEITPDQLKQLISEAALKDLPGYSKANVSFTVGPSYSQNDQVIGHELKKITVSLSNPT